jgi:hypothetical protein
MNIAMNRIMKEFKEVVANESVRNTLFIYFISKIFILIEWN